MGIWSRKSFRTKAVKALDYAGRCTVPLILMGLGAKAGRISFTSSYWESEGKAREIALEMSQA